MEIVEPPLDECFSSTISTFRVQTLLRRWKFQFGLDWTAMISAIALPKMKNPFSAGYASLLIQPEAKEIARIGRFELFHGGATFSEWSSKNGNLTGSTQKSRPNGLLARLRRGIMRSKS
jgi:hypothetical protein